MTSKHAPASVAIAEKTAVYIRRARTHKSFILVLDPTKSGKANWANDDNHQSYADAVKAAGAKGLRLGAKSYTELDSQNVLHAFAPDGTALAVEVK